ncbi:MAG TPA: hypothetical protein VLJ16_10505 [Acidobacteriota bacterium]|nr:hypothetical protein [Acidobacteriota bacterium]
MSRRSTFLATGALILACLAGQEIRPPDAASPSLASVLIAAREYCAKLERAALDFVCIEEVEERLDLSLDDRESLEQRARTATMRDPATQTDTRSRFVVRRNPKQKNIYLYDYQFIRREGQVEEKRVLLRKNGRKADPQADVPRLSAFNYSDILLGPVRLLDERFEAYYSYRLLGPDVASGTDAWVLEVVPRMAGVSPYLGGKIWLKRGDASVLRIEWDPATFGHYEEIVARAEIFKAEPEVLSITEFGFEKNGIRFPSSDLTEEGYRQADDKVFVRARTQITYKDYKFFMVETSSTFKK